jgi:hypothetical protein
VWNRLRQFPDDDYVGSDSAATVAMPHAAEAVAPLLDVQVTAVDVHGGVEIERAIATFASQSDGLVVTPHPRLPPNRGTIFLLAARHRLPAVYSCDISQPRAG